MIFDLPVKFREAVSIISDKGYEQFGDRYIGTKVNDEGFCIACDELSIIIGKAVCPFDLLPPAKSTSEILVPLNISEPATIMDEVIDQEVDNILMFGPTGIKSEHGYDYAMRFIRAYGKMRASEQDAARTAARNWSVAMKHITVLDVKNALFVSDLFKTMPEYIDYRSGEPCVPFFNHPNKLIMVHSNPECTLYVRHNLAISTAIKEIAL